MAGRRLIFGGASGGADGSIMNSALLHKQRVPFSSSSSSSNPLGSLFLSGSSPFFGSRTMVSFEDVSGGKRPFFHAFDLHDENGEDDYDDYFQQPEKKRRLKPDQLQFLEKSFDTENKLEPERKVQLAKDLGLQPRQVAIWFQNRRARWKTKQVEKDYEVLQASYNALKDSCDNLRKENEDLKAKVLHLSDQLLLKEKGTEDSLESFHRRSPSEARQIDCVADVTREREAPKISISTRQDENYISGSDVVNSESPQNTDGAHSSCYVFEQDQSDGSQDEEDNFSNSFPPPLSDVYSKVEGDSAYFGFPGDDQVFGFWSY